MFVRPLFALALALAVLPSGPARAASEAAVAAHKDGLRYAKENLLTEAVEALERAVKLDAGYAEAWADLGNTHIARGSLPDAIKAFDAAVRIRPEFQVARYNLAYALRKTANHKRAVEQYRLYLQRDPEDADACYGLADSLKALGEPVAAAEAYDDYAKVEKRPGQEKWVEKAKAEAKALRASVASAEAAGRETKPAVEERPRDVKAEAARDERAAAIVAGDTFPPPTNARATKLSAEQLERMKAEGTAARLHPRSLDEGLAALKAGDYKAARKLLEAAAGEAPEDAITLAALASAELALGRGERAEASYRRALATAKKEALPGIHFGIAEALRLQGELGRAAESYRAAKASEGLSAALKKLIEEREAALR